MDTQQIPVVDLSDYLSGDPARISKFVKALGKAFSEYGFVSVTNHGLSNELTADLYEQVEAFFALPEDVKLQYLVPGLAGQRGYTPFGKEHAKGHNAGDLKEFWQFGQHVTDDPVLKAQYPNNIHVTELPSFNPIGMQAFKVLQNSGAYLLEAIALYLGLDKTFFADKIKNGNSILRAIHYPPITSEPKSAVRAAAHEDINLITLLMGASAAGLEILTKKGNWLPVTALPNAVVVNVGDMLQRLTNNALRSTTHRVVNPPRELWGTSRFSIPFFLHPISEMRLDCLDVCVSDANPAAFDPISAGEYLDERLREIGLK
jgi:isopenicillin N synthase-like dioxygenase